MACEELSIECPTSALAAPDKAKEEPAIEKEDNNSEEAADDQQEEQKNGLR